MKQIKEGTHSDKENVKDINCDYLCVGLYDRFI